MATVEVNRGGHVEARPGQRRVEGIPRKMKALQYSAPEKFAVVQIDVPEIRDDEVLVKVTACGVCGTDLHYHKGEFLAKFPLIPGHEITGTIAALGRSVTTSTLQLHTAVAIDPLLPCESCTFCTTRQPLLCTALTAYGGNAPGGFAQYAAFPAVLVHALPASIPQSLSQSLTQASPLQPAPGVHTPLTPQEAVLIEPAACALHGIERMDLKPGARVLLFGCGPTGLLLAQLLRMNGCAHLTVASRGGPKLELARRMGVADEFVEMPEGESESESGSEGHGQSQGQCQTQGEESISALLTRHPTGWDVVIEATGSISVLQHLPPLVRKGGKLVLYGVYPPSARISWSPLLLWERELTVLASFCSMQHVPQVLQYVGAGRLQLQGVVDRVFGVEEWAECLGVVARGECVKAVVVWGE